MRPRTATCSLVPGAAMRRRHEAERDGAIERGREAAGGDAADRGAGGIEDFGALAGRGALDEEADADAAQIAGEFLEDAWRAGEIGGLAAALGDGEVEPGLGGRDRLVEVVAVERQAGLEAQAVAGAKADRLDALVGEKGVPERRGAIAASQRISKPSSPV